MEPQIDPSSAIIPPTLNYAPQQAGGSRVAFLLRLVLVAGLLCGIGFAARFLFSDPRGQQLMEDPRARHREVQEWVEQHRMVAPSAYMAVYVAFATLGLPVWWLQIMAGYAFGLVHGIVYTLVASTIAAVLTVSMAGWLFSGLMSAKGQARMSRLRGWQEQLGHNGLLVVIAARIVHVMPFGLSNYAFGILKIPMMDVAVGTFLGALPATTLYVALGLPRNPETHHRPITSWEMLLALLVMHILLAVPLILRYRRPLWFKRFGME